MSLRFCFDDGTELVNKPVEGGAPETLVMPSSAAAQSTIQAATPQFTPIDRPIPPTQALPVKRRNAWPWFAGAGALLLIGIAAFAAIKILLPRPPLTMHLVMRVIPTSPGSTDVVNQTVNVIKNRLNAAGVSHFQINSSGDQIFLDLPTLKDPERIKRLISTSGKLELLHVVSPPSPSPVTTYSTQEEAIASLNAGGTIPPNRRVLTYAEREEHNPASKSWVVVESPAVVDGNDLRDARAVSRVPDDYDIEFTLNKNGAAKFGAWTGANINEYIGVALNDEVKSIAFIKSQITDQGQISGRFTRQAAEDLALVLKSGALPGRIQFEEERNDK
jgi:protein-export membrane protein SecD